MLFGSRETASVWERLRLWLWPRKSWRRSALYYMKRILRLSGTPYAIAMGTGVGVFTAVTPLVGLHFIIAFALAWALRANMIAGAIGTCVGNPLTYPFIWAGTYEVGQLILHGSRTEAPAGLHHELAHKSLAQLLPLLEPMLIGSLPLGLCAGCLAYLVVHRALSAYRSARQQRLAARREQTGEAASAAAGKQPRA